MNKQLITIISENLSIPFRQVQNTIALLEDKATIPFISRYRKEATGGLDETQITAISEQREKLEELEKRKETILASIEKQDKLTPELKEKIESTFSATELEDMYLPYKPKRKTRASVAKEKGLEPLAQQIFEQRGGNVHETAKTFLSEKVETVEDALQGARDIIAEMINENRRARMSIRRLFGRNAVIKSKVVKDKEEEAQKYKDYFAYEEPLKKCRSHRLLAMRRGEKEGFLRLSVFPPEDEAIENLEKIFIKNSAAHFTENEDKAAFHVKTAIKDGYKRLLQPAIETEYRNLSKEKADKEAIKVFTENLRQLLLAPPLGQKRVLAIDPGYRTGCKVVCLDEQGNLLHNETIYPHKPQQETKQSIKKILALINAYNIEAIAIGNGTASRETEYFISKKIKYDRKVQVFVVSEDGASVYSASAVARQEFPQYDVTVRGAVSIGRRLMDPLAELVKIDPKSIGVGQYQHDVNQEELKKSLDRVVESCVNKVGVNVNTASQHLLAYISGLGPVLAKNMVEYRKENGAFPSRKALKKVARMGDKSFQQCAGFLRIPDAVNPLDNSAVHPESYHIVEKMATESDCKVIDLLKNEELRNQIDINRYVDDTFGLPTLKDIMQELSKPGRDPRKHIKVFEFSDDIFTIDDLEVGMRLPGIVTNITNFGAFVDIGIKENGLIHISNLRNDFVSNPADVVSLHEKVEVKIISIDKERKRIQLSMKEE